MLTLDRTVRDSNQQDRNDTRSTRSQSEAV